jgi:superfamily II DNA or RNA helicase
MDEDSLKLGLLLETAQTHQKLVEALIEKLKEHTQGIGAVVRDEVHRALAEQLTEIEQQANQAAAAA